MNMTDPLISNNINKPRNDGKALPSDPNLDPTGHRIPSLDATGRNDVVSILHSSHRMTTISPFPDLNTPPDSQPGTSSSAAITPIPVKSEPVEESVKTEPLEETDLVAQYSLLHDYFTSKFDELSNSRAIVPVPESDSIPQPPPGFGNHQGEGVSTTVVSPRPQSKYQRPTELARVTDLGPDQEKLLREVFKRTRMVFDALRMYLTKEDMKSPGRRKPRSDIKASNLMRERGLWLNQDKHIVGFIPGVKIGDIFFYREELRVVGLHGQPQAGIDSLTAHRSSNGEPIATSIIVSGGYEDDQDTGNVLVYTGHGGQDKLHRQCQHQKLEGGNLAMERSMYYEIEVRVIRGIKYDNNVSSKVYVYDGLYRIVNCWLAVGKSSFGVYKFHLVRIPGQPEMGSVMMKFAKVLRSNPLTVRPAGYVSFDISRNRETVPVYLYNDIDGDWEPLNYEYTPKSVIPHDISAQAEINRIGCDCSFSCSDDCLCARKNGGEFAYDDNGDLLRGKPVVFECGKFCRCSPSCKNRVTQKGLKNRLEVFRSKETGWGVRTLDIIHAGAFICEFAGVMLTRHQAGILSMNGDNMVYPGHFTEKWRNWGDLSQVFPDDVRPGDPSLPPLDFAMDVSKMRNVACYISHNKEPNVMVQFVLYDHNNLMFPRVMLFALENIPPLAELSLDYGLADEVNGKLAICN